MFKIHCYCEGCEFLKGIYCGANLVVITSDKGCKTFTPRYKNRSYIGRNSMDIWKDEDDIEEVDLEQDFWNTWGESEEDDGILDPNINLAPVRNQA